MSNVYDLTDAFDKAITKLSQVPNKPDFIIDAAVEVHDTLKLANTSAKAIFGKDASPDIAVKIYDRVEASRISKVNDFEADANETNKYPDAWLKSDLAACEMAERLGINTQSCKNHDDVRYLISKKLAENAGNAGA